MRLLLLGTTGYHPNDQRHTACMMLPDIGVVLDAGTGMYRVRDHLKTKTLDVFLTHAHLDHVVGITFLFDILYGKDVGRVTIHGAEDKLAAIREHLFHESLFPVAAPCEWASLDAPVAIGDGGTLSFFPLKHPGGSLGFRLDWPDRSMAYVTDTVADDEESYVESIRGVDLLLHECYFPDEWHEQAKLTGHSWTTAVARVAQAAEVGRLVLVHVNPLSLEDDPIGLPNARRVFPHVVIAHDNMEIEF